MRQVLIYRNELLPASETFIAGQSEALRRYSPWFTGLKRVAGGLPLDPHRVLSLTTGHRLADKLLYRSYLRSGISPAFHRRLRAVHPSLIHAHFAVDACAALALRRRLRVPLLVTLHGYDVLRHDRALADTPAGRLYLQLRNRMQSVAALFLCVSDHIRDNALERGFPPEKLVVLHIGIDLPELAPAAITVSAEPPLVLFVGRMVEKKGCLHLLHAMRRVQAAMPKAKLVLLGDGPLLPVLKHEAKTHLHNTDFHGMCSPSEVRHWMSRATLLAAPSIVAADGDAEGLPTVLCEAQAMALPIVSFEGPGVNEAVSSNHASPGQTALLVPQRDEVAFSEAILRLLRDRALCKRLGAAGRKRSEDLFDLRKQTALLEEKYDEVVSRSEYEDAELYEATGSRRNRAKTSFDSSRPRSVS